MLLMSQSQTTIWNTLSGVGRNLSSYPFLLQTCLSMEVVLAGELMAELRMSFKKLDLSLSVNMVKAAIKGRRYFVCVS